MIVDLEKLKALDAAATPGPWEFRNGHSREGDSIDILMAEVGKANDGEEPEYAHVFDDEHGERQVQANWELTCEARNALPVMAAELDRLRVENAKLEGALACSNATAKRRGTERDAAVARAAVLREALEQVKAAIGDRLLACGPLSKEYAHAVLDEINQAICAPREKLSEAICAAFRAGYEHGEAGAVPEKEEPNS